MGRRRDGDGTDRGRTGDGPGTEIKTTEKSQSRDAEVPDLSHCGLATSIVWQNDSLWRIVGTSGRFRSAAGRTVLGTLPVVPRQCYRVWCKWRARRASPNRRGDPTRAGGSSTTG